MAVGVDLGGTRTRAAIIDEIGTVRGRIIESPTYATGPREACFERIVETIESAVSESGVSRQQICGIGIGTTGPLDPARGLLLDTETLPALRNFALGRELGERFGLAIAMTNDANAFALGEALFGAARGERIVLGVTLGTGCGVGIVIEGRILDGATANAGEMYRAPLEDGTFDTVLSGVGIESLFAARTGERAQAFEIASRAERGDPIAREIFAVFGERLARGLGILAAVIDPAVIVLGGSVSRSAPYFLERARLALPEFIAPSAAERLRLEVSTLGDVAGVAGAAALLVARRTG
ncbi:MAG TPA: ROK family protein [Planctomycetota bacterium]|nr:ROK family protein [Planctomycetota bacterium]